MGRNREEYHFLAGVTCHGGALRNRIVVPEWNSSVFPVKARNLPGIGSKYHTGQLPLCHLPLPYFGSSYEMNAQETPWNYNVTAIPKIEQLPADVKDPNAPNASNSENANEAATWPFSLSKTGDSTPLLALTLMVVALAAFVCMVVCRNKRQTLAFVDNSTNAETTTSNDATASANNNNNKD